MERIYLELWNCCCSASGTTTMGVKLLFLLYKTIENTLYFLLSDVFSHFMIIWSVFCVFIHLSVEKKPANSVTKWLSTVTSLSPFSFREFKRVLPLPNGNWNAIVDDWCCHPDPFANKKLLPRTEDCLLGDTFVLLTRDSSCSQTLTEEVSPVETADSQDQKVREMQMVFMQWFLGFLGGNFCLFF